MANDYYTHGTTPATGSPGSSAVMRAELDLVMGGFAKLPTLTANGLRAVVVNPGGTALTLTTGTLVLGGEFTTSGGHAITLTTTGATGVTLPTTGVLVSDTVAATLTNKTLTSPTINGGTITSATLASSSLTGTYSVGGNATINTPVNTGHAIGGSGSSTVGLTVRPTFTSPGGGFATGVDIATNITAATNDSVFTVAINTQVAKAASGTHNYIDGLSVHPPTITGVATASVASTVRIVNAPASGATEMYALYVEAGSVRFGSTSPLKLNSGQLTFPSVQNASADANTLDDYEEGSWTPSVGGTATYIARSGSYTKIGRIVHIRGSIQINVLGTGSQSLISDLPFTAAAVDHGISFGTYTSLATAVTALFGRVNASADTVSLFGPIAASTSNTTTSVIFGNNTAITFSGFYSV